MFVAEYANDNDGDHEVPNRTRRISIAKRKTLAMRKSGGGDIRPRRGILTIIPSPWRRMETGTNRISNLGVWPKGTRRPAIRANREGTTDWQRPHRANSKLASGPARLVS